MYSGANDDEYTSLFQRVTSGKHKKLFSVLLIVLVLVLLGIIGGNVALLFLYSGKLTDLQTKVAALEISHGHLQFENELLRNMTASVQEEIDALTQRVLSIKAPCSLQCVNGGYPNPTCDSCTGCNPGWSGLLCNIPNACSALCSGTECMCHNGGLLNAQTCTCECLKGWKGFDCSVLDSNVTTQDRINVLKGLRDSALAALQEKLGAPIQAIPTNVGNGIDMITQAIGLPVLQMVATTNSSQTILSPNGQVYAIPEGIQYGEILGGFTWPVHHTNVYEHFYDYVYQTYQWSNEDGGYIKPTIRGVSLDEIKKKYFTGTSFMAMTQDFYGAYEMTLNEANIGSYALDPHAKRAIDYISQLPYNTQNQAVYNYFLQTWGTSVITNEVQGGLLQYACIIQSAIWHWGGQGKVSESFVKGEVDAMFRDTMHKTHVTSAYLSQNSICNFYCSGGNPEKCPTPQTASNSDWTSTIWSDPQTIKFNIVPLPEVVTDSAARHNLQQAIYSYYQTSISAVDNYESCTVCLPSLNSYVIASEVPFDRQTTVAAGTCSTGIRVVAWGSCTFIMTDNGKPIDGGTDKCDYKNRALWGVAAVYGMTAPVVEWIETDVGKDHTYVSSKCDYSGITCNYWSGHYSVFCV